MKMRKKQSKIRKRWIERQDGGFRPTVHRKRQRKSTKKDDKRETQVECKKTGKKSNTKISHQSV